MKNMALTPRSSLQKLDENQAHMSMWCITSSPLIAGLRMGKSPHVCRQRLIVAAAVVLLDHVRSALLPR